MVLFFVGSESKGGKPAELSLLLILRVSYLLIYVCLVFISYVFALIIMYYALVTISLDALRLFERQGKEQLYRPR